MAYQTMTDIAYNCLLEHHNAIEFLTLWDEVKTTLNIPANLEKRKRGQFYSEIMLDNRFYSLKDNKWDLKSRYSFNETHIDTSAIELGEDEDEFEETTDENSEKINDEDY